VIELVAERQRLVKDSGRAKSHVKSAFEADMLSCKKIIKRAEYR